ncbi:MAG: hypothetical protein AAF399_08860 [Bacteroidota bacterium]
MNPTLLLPVLVFGIALTACSPNQGVDPTDGPKLHISFVMDPTAGRLDNLGNPAELPPENAGQNPEFEVLGLHFVGLYPDKFTPYEAGVTAFSSPTTEAGGIAAIDFEEVLLLTDAENELSIPLSEVPAGTYEFIRSSIAFQKYQLQYNLAGAAQNPDWPAGVSDDVDVSATLASFLGYNTYIGSYTMGSETVEVNANKLQGYFGLASSGEVAGFPFNNVTEGDAPQTTVPNPISDTSPVPVGSCVVTGQFPSALVIPENPNEDIFIEVVISTNQSFEWRDDNGNGKYEPLLGEQVVDMGTRGVFPEVL